MNDLHTAVHSSRTSTRLDWCNSKWYDNDIRSIIQASYGFSDGLISIRIHAHNQPQITVIVDDSVTPSVCSQPDDISTDSNGESIRVLWMDHWITQSTNAVTQLVAAECLHAQTIYYQPLGGSDVITACFGELSIMKMNLNGKTDMIANGYGRL